MQTAPTNSATNLSSLENITKLAPIFTVLILAISITFDSAYLLALGLSLADIPSSISEHIRSALLWSPIIFALLFFINMLYMIDDYAVKNPQKITSSIRKFRYLIINIIVISFISYLNYYYDTNQYSFLGIAVCSAAFLMLFLDVREEKKIKTAPLVVFILCLPMLLSLFGYAGYYYGDKLIKTKNAKWEYIIKKEEKEITLTIFGQRRFTEFTIAITESKKILIIPNSNILSTKSL